MLQSTAEAYLRRSPYSMHDLQSINAIVSIAYSVGEVRETSPIFETSRLAIDAVYWPL